MKAVHSVLYNDGTDEDQFALVVKDEAVGDTLLTLLVFDSNGNGGIVEGVPRREKADYGSEGGGRTWHVD